MTERARAKWEDAAKHPAYERPAPPSRRRHRREQGATQEATTEAETEQQQTLSLFQEPVGVTNDRRNTGAACRRKCDKPPPPGPIY